MNLVKEWKIKKDTSLTSERKALKKDRPAGKVKNEDLKFIFGCLTIIFLGLSGILWVAYNIDFESGIIGFAIALFVLSIICFIVFVGLFFKKKNKSAYIPKREKASAMVSGRIKTVFP